MSNEDHRPSPTVARSSRGYLVAVILIASSMGVVFFVTTRGDEPVNANSSSPSRSKGTITSTAKPPDPRSEVVARLREILDVREQAFRQRDASLFDEVYTSDCPCLRAGRDAIAALKKENVQWTHRSISIQVGSVRSINNRLWEVVAIFTSDSFRIETEDGVLVRDVPAERIRYRFLLVRSSDTDPWRLGNASPLEG
jgi:hypothetical protein